MAERQREGAIEPYRPRELAAEGECYSGELIPEWENSQDRLQGRLSSTERRRLAGDVDVGAVIPSGVLRDLIDLDGDRETTDEELEEFGRRVSAAMVVEGIDPTEENICIIVRQIREVGLDIEDGGHSSDIVSGDFASDSLPRDIERELIEAEMHGGMNEAMSVLNKRIGNGRSGLPMSEREDEIARRMVKKLG